MTEPSAFEQAVQFWYTLVTGGLLIWASVASFLRANRTVQHRRPVFWLRFVACTILTLTFALGFFNNHLTPLVPVQYIGYVLEVSLFLMTLSYIATAALDREEVKQAAKVMNTLPTELTDEVAAKEEGA